MPYGATEGDRRAAIELAKELLLVHPRPQVMAVIVSIKDNCDMCLLEAREIVHAALNEVVRVWEGMHY